MSLQSTFSIKLPNKILTRRVCVGKFDEKDDALTIVASTTGGRILTYDLSRSSKSSSRTAQSSSKPGGSSTRLKIETGEENSGGLMPPGTSVLNVNQEVTALAVGRLKPGTNRDVLVVGTQQSVFAYDVYDNADLFHREITDGVNCIAVGRFGGVCQTIIGGNCCVQGFDHEGKDRFWTVTGDNVTAICLADITKISCNQLVVGTEDFDLKVFSDDESIIQENSETSAVIHLLDMHKGRYAYALDNGTLGAYDGAKRMWRIKSKNRITTLLLHSLPSLAGDSTGPQLVTGWTNGKVDFRKIETGEVLLRETLSSAIAGCISTRPVHHEPQTSQVQREEDGQLAADQEHILVAVTTEGEIRGFVAGAPNTGPGETLMTARQELLHELHNQRQTLELELANYRQSRRKEGGYESEDLERENAEILGTQSRDDAGTIPSNTQLQTSLYVHPGGDSQPTSPKSPSNVVKAPSSVSNNPCVELTVETSNETLVRCVIVFAEGVFPGESHVIHPPMSEIGRSLRVKMRPERDIAVDLHVKCFVGYKNSVQYHVFELSRAIPAFAMFALCSPETPLPEGFVKFKLPENTRQIAAWVNSHFLLTEEVEVLSDGKINGRFLSLREKGVVAVTASPNVESGSDVLIYSRFMEQAGDFVHSLAVQMNVAELASTCEFPEDIQRLEELLDRVNEAYATREKMTAEMANQVGTIKAKLIRAEEARMLGDYSKMKAAYTALNAMNQELIMKHKLRTTQHEDLLLSLRTVNQIIQAAGRLRVGQPKTKVIQACRNAIKDNDYKLLSKIIRLG